MSNTADHNRALGHGMSRALQELLKIPPFNSLITGIQEYQAKMAELERESLFYDLDLKVHKLEKQLDDIGEWYSSTEGQEFYKKTVASILNWEYSDKREFFINAMLNAPFLQASQMDRLKYVELLRSLSKPALTILANTHGFQPKANVELEDPKFVNFMANKTGIHSDTVRACVTELHSAGVFSQPYPGKWATLGPFARKFIEFIREP